MKRVAMLFGIAAACCGAPGLALDLDGASRAKVVTGAANPGSAAHTAMQQQATTFSHNPLPDLPAGVDLTARNLARTPACSNRDLCYDYQERKLVYRPSRNWMPEIEGLTAEHMSLRRGVVSFKYSFK